MYFHLALYRSIRSGWAILLLFCATRCYSQDFIYQHLGVRDGLPNPIISCIYQDKQGFLWIGTTAGLCRYDGNNIKVFTIKDGLPTNRVLDLFEDSKGRTWLYHISSTIAYMRDGKIYNQYNDSILRKVKLNSGPYAIVEDHEGNVAIADEITLYIISKDGKVRTLYPRKLGLLNLQYLYIDKTGEMVIMAEKAVGNSPQLGLFKLNGDQLSPVKMLYTYRQLQDTSLAGSMATAHYAVANLYSGKSIVFLEDSTITVKAPMGNTYETSAVSDSVLSFNTIDGAFLFNTHTCQYSQLLPGVQVTKVYPDREKNLWIGTATQGVFKISSQVIRNIRIGNNQNDIYYVSKEDGKIIAGNSNKEVFEVDKKGQVKKLSPAGSREHTARVIYLEKTGKHKYLVGHAIGLMIYENGSVKEEIKTNVSHVSPLDKDNILAATHYGIYIADKNDLSDFRPVWPRKSTAVFYTNDTLLAGGFPGLFILKKSNEGYALVDSLLPAVTVRDIKKSANNLVWICTFGHGVYCMKDGKIIRQFSEKNGLPSDNGRCLYINHNDVWVGTAGGLVKITQVSDSFQLKKWSISDGLASDVITSIYVEGTEIYLGTPEGLSFFDERAIETSSFCNLVLTGISIGDSTVDQSEKYILRTNERISIEFSGISFRSEHEMSYRSKLHGLDNNWRTTKLNLLEYTALPHGDYELEVVAINKFGIESKPLKIRFEVVRPFHKTTWFLLLIILLPAVPVLLLINRRISRSRQNQLLKLQQEVRITQLEQMALRAQMNPHFIFNCISVMQQLVTEKDTNNASRFIARFADLVRQTLDNAPELMIPLTEEIKFLTNYFELERIRLEDRFAYAIRTEGLQNKEKFSVPNMVIQPFVENAIKHGIRYKKNGKGFIEVIFEQKENQLRCTITDNGIGREKAMQMRKESGISHQSQGMSITMRRIESLNALTGQKIYIDIEDLKDGQQLAAGTRVRIDFHTINEHHDKDIDN